VLVALYWADELSNATTGGSMRKAKTMGLALVAMLAFGALTTAAASAHEWLSNGAPMATSSGTYGDLNLNFEESHFKLKAVCRMYQKGVVGPGNKGKIESIISQATETAAVICENARPSGIYCYESPITIEAAHLPWTTELASVGGELRDVIEATGEPEWIISCKGALGSFREVCSAATNLGAQNLTGHVEGIFDSKSPAGSCAIGELLRFSGSTEFRLSNGHSLSVV
jgi:hypothetical protein